jgi:hypothetical protein
MQHVKQLLLPIRRGQNRLTIGNQRNHFLNQFQTDYNQFSQTFHTNSIQTKYVNPKLNIIILKIKTNRVIFANKIDYILFIKPISDINASHTENLMLIRGRQHCFIIKPSFEFNAYINYYANSNVQNRFKNKSNRIESN